MAHTKQTTSQSVGTKAPLKSLSREAGYKSTLLSCGFKEPHTERLDNRPHLDTLEDFFQYVKLNKKNVYKYEATSESQYPIRVSITHARGNSSGNKSGTVVHQKSISKDTKFSFKCSTNEIRALFFAMWNFGRFEEITSDDEYDTNRLDAEENSLLYTVHDWGVYPSQQKDSQLDSNLFFENDLTEDGESWGLSDKFMNDIKSRIKDNKYTYYADTGGGKRLKIIISLVTKKQISIEMLYDVLYAAPPLHFEKIKYNLDFGESTILMYSLWDMLSHVQGNATHNLTKIFREDIQGENDIRYIEINSQIPQFFFGNVSKYHCYFVGIDHSREDVPAGFEIDTVVKTPNSSCPVRHSPA